MADRRIYELATKSAALGANDYFAVDNGTEAESKKLPTSYFTDQLADMQNVYGAKNLIPYPYYRPSGYTSGNMTGTYDANGVITINKTADTTTRYFALYNGEPFLLPNTTYTLSLELTNATNTSVYMADGVGAGLDMAAIRNKATGKYDVTFTTPSTFNDNLIIGLYYGKDIVETNAIVKVMLRLASIQDDTWVPYAKTNKELTDAFKNQVANKDDEYSPSKPYEVGDRCIYNNVLYKCITACSAAAWSVNQTNFEATTLAESVTELNSALSNLYYVRKNITATSGTEYAQVDINPNTTIILAAYDIETSNARKKIVCYAQPDLNKYGLYGVAGTQFNDGELIDFVCYKYT